MITFFLPCLFLYKRLHILIVCNNFGNMSVYLYTYFSPFFVVRLFSLYRRPRTANKKAFLKLAPEADIQVIMYPSRQTEKTRPGFPAANCEKHGASYTKARETWADVINPAAVSPELRGIAVFLRFSMAGLIRQGSSLPFTLHGLRYDGFLTIPHKAGIGCGGLSRGGLSPGG